MLSVLKLNFSLNYGIISREYILAICMDKYVIVHLYHLGMEFVTIEDNCRRVNISDCVNDGGAGMVG